MAKFTRRIKKYHNKTKLTRRNHKKGGAAQSNQVQNSVETNNLDANTNNDEREGVIDLITDKAKTAATTVAEKVEDVALHAAGLQKIQSNLPESSTSISEEEPGILSTATNFANKATGAVISNLNEVLASDAFQEGTKQAAEETAAILGSTAETFNETLNDPLVKEKVEEALDTASEYAGILAESMEKPVNKAADVFAQAIPKATGAAISGAIKVGTDAMAAVPGLGGVIELGKMINDGSKAASAVIEAGTEAVESASDLYLETSENFKKGLAELEEKKRMAEQISNRTTQSINQFSKPFGENPLDKYPVTKNPLEQKIPGVLKGGANKTRKRLFKNRIKSKRVRFSL